jgi:hypothetical protein
MIRVDADELRARGSDLVVEIIATVLDARGDVERAVERAHRRRDLVLRPAIGTAFDDFFPAERRLAFAVAAPHLAALVVECAGIQSSVERTEHENPFVARISEAGLAHGHPAATGRIIRGEDDRNAGDVDAEIDAVAARPCRRREQAPLERHEDARRRERQPLDDAVG